MRSISKPSTARCSIDTYIKYLLIDPIRTSCTGLSDVLPNTSHDSVNRFLLRENYIPKDLYESVRDTIDLEDGTISVDNSILDKPYSDPKKADLVQYHYSGKHKRTVKGSGLGMLFGIDKSRIVSLEKGTYINVGKIENWDEDGVVVYLKDFGMVKVFRQVGKNTNRYYMVAMPQITMLNDFHQSDYKHVHSAHWNIEEYHRALKQLCNIRASKTWVAQTLSALVYDCIFPTGPYEVRASRTVP